MKIGLDKQLHFLGCFAIAASLHLATGNAWLGVGVAVVIGVAKEAVDSRKPLNFFSWTDILANIAGIVAFLCCYYLGLFFSRAV